MKKLKVLLTIVISSVIMITGCTNIENNINNNDTDLVENTDINDTEISDKESSNIKEIKFDITSLDANSG